MRIEKRFLAYGHELDSDVTPLEAGLDFAVCWRKDFIGKEALLAEKARAPKTRIVSILLDDREAVPLGNEPVYLDGRIVGKTTSAAFGYRVQQPVALAAVDATAAIQGASLSVEVDLAGERFAGELTQAPAFDPKGSRMRPAR